MATTTIKVPDIGDFDEVDVIEVLVSEGDSVEAEQSLITLESDKATMEVPAPESGTVKAVKTKVGDKVKEGAVILEMEPQSDQGEEGKTEEQPAEPETPPAETPPQPSAGYGGTSETDRADTATESAEPPPEAVKAQHPVHQLEADHAPVSASQINGSQHRLAHASPAVRRYARELGVDLSQVQGSGRKNRILKDDVQAFVKSALQAGPAAQAPASGGMGIPPIPEVDFSKYGEIEEVPMSRIKRISGPHLHRSWLNVPHVTQYEDADITDLEAFRKAEKAAAEKEGVRLTALAFMVKASAYALKKYPEFNSSIKSGGGSLILKKYINIGFAVDTEGGLVVPVVRDADKKGIYQIAMDLAELSQKARDGKLASSDMQGGTFSISSLGGIGGTAFTPLVNAPEVAILGIARSEMKPKWNGSEFVPRLILPLALSYDHRAIDGAAGTRFVTYLAGLLSDLRRLVL